MTQAVSGKAALLGVTALWAALGASRAGLPGSGHQELVVTERAALAVPPEWLEGGGAQPMSPTTVLVWSSEHGVHLLDLASGAVEEVERRGVRGLRLIPGPPPAFEVIPSTQRDLQGSSTHTASVYVPSGGPAEVVSVVASGSRWFFLEVDETGIVSLYEAMPSQPRLLAAFDEGVGHANQHFITTWNAHLLITCSGAPYRVRVIGVDDHSQSEWGLGLSVAEDSIVALMTAGTWRSLAVVPLGRGYLRTLVNLEGSDRVFLRHGARGELERATRIAAPLAFIGSDPDQRLLVGLRRAERLEVVLYEWSWAPH